MKPVSCAVLRCKTSLCVISSRLASPPVSTVSAVMDGTHLNTSVSLRSTVYLGTKLHFRPDHSQDVQLHAPPPPFYALLSIHILDCGNGDNINIAVSLFLHSLHVHKHIHDVLVTHALVLYMHICTLTRTHIHTHACTYACTPHLHTHAHMHKHTRIYRSLISISTSLA